MTPRSRSREELEHTVEVLRRTAGAGAPRTAIAELQLSVLLRREGDLAGARQLAGRAVRKLRKALGEEDRRTLAATMELAWALLASGKTAEGEQLVSSVHATTERLCGDKEPTTAVALTNLALARRARGDLDGARRMQEKATETLAATLGRDDPVALAAEGNLAAIAGVAGDRSRAQAILERILRARRKQLGKEHPLVLETESNLAGVYRAGGELRKAQAIQEHVVDVLESHFGKNHPSTVGASGDLAVTLAAGRSDSGVQLGRQVFGARREMYGRSHPQTIQSMLTISRAARGRRGRRGRLARGFGEDAVVAAGAALGPRHPDTMRAYDELADLLEEQDEPKAAATARAKGTGMAAEARAPVDNLAGTLTAEDAFIEGDFTQRPLELPPVPRDVVTRTGHVELKPARPLKVGEKLAVEVFTDRAPAVKGRAESELQIFVPPAIRELLLDVWLVTSRHLEVEGPAIRRLTVDRDIDRSKPVRFRARVIAGRDEFSEDPELRVSFSYSGWPSGRVTVPVRLAESRSIR